MFRRQCLCFIALSILSSPVILYAQPLGVEPPRSGPGGSGGAGGPGGPGGPGGSERKVLKQFDSDENGWLNGDERTEARVFLKENPSPQGGGGRGPGGGRGFGPPPGFGPPDGERPPREIEGPGGRPGRGGLGGPGGPGFGPPGGGPPGGGPPGMGRGRPEATEGERIEKSSVQPLQAKLYDNELATSASTWVITTSSTSFRMI